MTTTAEMTAALKENFMPSLRKAGFKGSFPNFYRDNDNFVCLVNIQFNSLGEKFCINLGFVDPERKNVSRIFDDVEPKKLRVNMTGRLIENDSYLSGRWRVGSQRLPGGTFSDSWFTFAAGQYGKGRSVQAADPDKLARRCVTLFEEEAERWWSGRRAFAAGEPSTQEF